MSAKRRLGALNNHLLITENENGSQLEPRGIYNWLTRDNIELRIRMLNFLKDTLYQPHYHLSLDDFRALTIERLVKFTQQRFFTSIHYLHDPLRFMAGLEVPTFVDYSLSIKAGVHFTLCGGSICNLGTRKHHEAFLSKLDTLEERGCFAMTELGHGSNVMGIETTATYDVESKSFVINTPTNSASKFWIGGCAESATISTVFAQLTINDKWEGPHVFVVRLRDAEGNVMPGIRIRDNGHKAGLNGVDNGQIWFDNVKVPLDGLLDKYASVSPDGLYSSPIPTVGARFGTMVGGLTAGRILVAQGAVDGTKVALAIAIRYACMRPQFGQKLIITYLTHQRRLLPGLASTFALQLALLRIKTIFAAKDPKQAKLLHVMSSGVKAAATWMRREVMQECRECCGGQGYLAANKIGPMKNDMDIDQTFEGDNSVMMQQVSRALLDGASKKFPQPARPQLKDSNALADWPTLQQLLQFREETQTLEIAAAMQKARQEAVSSGMRPGKAVSEAYDANIDNAVSLGWSYVERVAFKSFTEELATAPAAAQGALKQLATLYGLTRIERGLSFFLASGALQPQHAAPLRQQVNGLCQQLVQDGGQTLIGLCNGFGIPDEILYAPIAFDWTQIGSEQSPI